MRMLWDNKYDVATLSPSTENVNHPIGNVIVRNTTRTWRTTSKDDQYLIASGITTPCTYVYLLNHNLTDGATVTIQGNATDSWGAPSFSETITVTDYVIAHAFASAQTYAYWRLVLDDPGNTDSYIEIGYAYLGPHEDGPGMKPDHVVDCAGTDVAQLSETRQSYGVYGVQYREYTINMPEMSDAERKALIAMHNAVRIFRPWMILIWPDDLEFETPMFCVFKQRPKFTRQKGYEYPWTGQIIVSEVY